MVVSSIRALSAVAVLISSALVAFPAAPSAAAEPCPDVSVVFARGTFEPPGIGGTGQAFVDALRTRLPDKSVEVRPVQYPATLDFTRAVDGVVDASNTVRDIAATCPDTEMVLGGFSQGAAVIAYLTSDTVPADYPLPPGITGPLSDSIAENVAAVALFGKPTNGFINMVDSTAPPITIGSLYAPKTIELCNAGDPVCSSGGDWALHDVYAGNGMPGQGADFVAARLSGVETHREPFN